MRRFGAHILIFTVASIAYAVVAFHFLGFLVRIFYNREGNDTIIRHLGHIFVMLFYALASFFMGVVGCVFAVLSVRQVLRPFSQDLNNPFRENLLLEF